MEQVTAATLDAYLDRYERARGGFANEETDSEAMFVMAGPYRGIYVLTTGMGPVWMGLQNAMARWTCEGQAFPSVRAATQVALTDQSHPLSRNLQLYYSEDAVARLRWIADRIDAVKASGDFLLYAEPT